MIKQTTLILISILLGATASNKVFSQDIYKNRISAFYNPINYFFDKTPISNGNVQMPSGSLRTMARLHYIGGFGVAYERKIKTNNYFHTAFNYFQATYMYNQLVYPLPEPCIGYRRYISLEINYLRKVPILKNFSFKGGGGLLFKYGPEVVIVAKNLIYSQLANSYGIEHHLQGIGKTDLALNALIRFEYTPKPIFTIFTDLTYNYTIIRADKKSMDRLKQLGLSKFPSRHELAWRVGFGFNFGKGISKKQKQKVVE